MDTTMFEVSLLFEKSLSHFEGKIVRKTGICASYPDKSVMDVHFCLDKSVMVCALASRTSLSCSIRCVEQKCNPKAFQG